ncbi:MAG: glycine betaine ABC transporter substrate-binding protein [Christensenellales bacterium]|jgi:glycine betaine/choline ABC-type transport system substrate-binding protein
MKKFIGILLAAMLLVIGAMAGCSNQDEVVRIGHKNYTEQRLAGQLLSVAIEEATDYKTEVIEFGGTMLCFEALNSDEIEVYPEYTGTAYGAILEQVDVLGPQETYDYVKNVFEDQHGITWLNEMGWNNTYILSVTAETAQELGVSTISELVPHAGDMVMGCDNEFLGRTDGLPGLKEAYGLNFQQELPMDQGLTYVALRDGEIDVNVSFSTDGRIAKFNLVNLEDDYGFFPPYYVAPILKQDYVNEHPAVADALNRLEGLFSDEDMQHYNLLVDEGGDPREVAIQALTDKGLVD